MLLLRSVFMPSCVRVSSMTRENFHARYISMVVLVMMMSLILETFCVEKNHLHFSLFICFWSSTHTMRDSHTTFYRCPGGRMSIFSFCWWCLPPLCTNTFRESLSLFHTFSCSCSPLYEILSLSFSLSFFLI